MTRSLYAARPNPYYVIAPDYRHNSAGIRVMHMLCDALIRSGYEAYVSTSVVSSNLMTPRLTAEIMDLHRTQGLEPVAVYPEVTSGNPLDVNVVARYLLNTPGFIGGDGVFDSTDMIFGYTKALLLPGVEHENVMFLNPVDLRLFRPHSDPSKRVTGSVCYYQGRQGTGIDKSILPENAIEITGTFPPTREALAEIFQSCEFFYSSATSALSAEAAACGCVGVVIPGESAPLNFSLEENGSYGVAWGLAPEEVQRARETLPLLRANLEQHEIDYWQALDHFIDVTQRAAQAFKARGLKDEVSEWLGARVLSSVQSRLIEQHLKARTVPVIDVLVIDPDAETELVARTLHSLRQVGSVQAFYRPVVLTTQVASWPMARVYHIDQDEIVTAVNRALEASEGDWFIILKAGEAFTPGGLAIAALELLARDDLFAVQPDEVSLQEDGSQCLLLRPDVNLDLLLSFPSSVARHWLFNRSRWNEAGRFSERFSQAFELQYILRLLETTGLQGLGHLSEPLLICDVSTLQACPQEQQAIEDYLHTRGFVDAQVAAFLPGRYRVDYGHPGRPLVSVLIVIDQHLAHAQRCVDSFLANTDYQAYELLLLDQGSEDPAICSWLLGVESLGVSHIRVLRYEAGQLADAIRNDASLEADGDFLLFLDAGIGVLSKDWIEQLLNHAIRPEVGCVGAKLVNGDRSIIHAGYVLGLGGAAGLSYKGMPGQAGGYMQRLEVDQNCTAVSGHCLMVRKEIFLEAQGFDLQFAGWADIDLCLRLQEVGYLHVWTPRVELLATGPSAGPVSPRLQALIDARWLKVMARDPSYNVNFSLREKRAFRPAEAAVSWRPLSSFRPLPVVLAQPARSVSGAWSRIIRPFDALRESGKIDGSVASLVLSLADIERHDPDVLLFQRQSTDPEVQLLWRIKATSRAFKLYDIDEFIPEPGCNPKSSKDLNQGFIKAVAMADRLIVASHELANALGTLCTDTRVVESRLDPRWWKGLSSLRRCGEVPRVGLFGAPAKGLEQQLFEQILKAFAGEVEWVFIGYCPAHLRALVQQIHVPLQAGLYPAQLAGLNLDLGIMMREDSLLNHCRSSQPLLEAGMCAIPVICSDLQPFRGGLPVKRVGNDLQAWICAIRDHLNDLDSAALLGDFFREKVSSEWLLDEKGLQCYQDAWLPNQ